MKRILTISPSDSYKSCKSCGEVKALSEFYRHPDMKDGHLNSCKDCRKAYQRSRPYDKEYERQRNQTEKRKAFLSANLKRWRRENPQKMAVQLARRRARKLNAEGDFTVEDFEALCEKYGNACLRCGGRNALLTPDHIVSLSLGGSNRIKNTQPLCLSCNSWKNVKVIDYRTDTILQILT
jgi:5-methylcytosine-specific restriction endonuclease McrA